MRKKIACGIFLTLLLASLPSLRVNIPRTKAWAGTINILADGSVDPPAAPITVNGDIYMLTDNILSAGDGIVVGASSVTVDVDGYAIQGSSNGKGVDLTGTTGVTVKNANVMGFSLGIVLASTSQDVISGNTITGPDNWDFNQFVR